MKIYVAAGWFTPEQEKARLDILECCNTAGIQVYSPKDDMPYIPGSTTPVKVFLENIRQITQCTAVVASTVGKDMGTIFECGYSYSLGLHIIYYYPSSAPFNLMLAASACAVCTTKDELQRYMEMVITKGYFPVLPYKKEVE